MLARSSGRFMSESFMNWLSSPMRPATWTAVDLGVLSAQMTVLLDLTNQHDTAKTKCSNHNLHEWLLYSQQTV